MTEMHPFERALSVAPEAIELELRGVPELPWADFWLHPRKLRGSDLLMRWSQGVWIEKRLSDATNSVSYTQLDVYKIQICACKRLYISQTFSMRRSKCRWHTDRQGYY